MSHRVASVPPSIPNPLGRIIALPTELVTALSHLSGIAESTEAMREHTAVLVDVGIAIEQVARDAAVLPTMDERMATIESAMPQLVEVQQHLAKLPETIEALDSRIVQMSSSLDQLLQSLDKLSVSVEQLQHGVEPLGRIAKRLPGSKGDPEPS